MAPGLKPLTRFRLKAGLRQEVAGAQALVAEADAEVGVPASAGSPQRPSGLGAGAMRVYPGLKPLTRFRLKAGLRQEVAGAPGLVAKADAVVGVPASAGSP